MSDFICPEGAVAIPLSGKLGKGLWVIVDAVDAERLSLESKQWYAHGGYAARQIAGKPLLMHRLILGAEKGTNVDHINGNPLDNRRANLRFATHAENMRNRKMTKHNRCGFKGVSVDKNGGSRPYRSTIGYEGKKYNLGRFATPEEAHGAYQKASKQLHGEFSRTS